MKRIFILALFLVIAGCGKAKVEVATEEQPLSVDEWKLLEVGEKYQPETLERLKVGDEELESERNWNRFMRDVVVPERRMDIPTDY